MSICTKEFLNDFTKCRINEEYNVMSCCEFLVIEEELCTMCNKGNENIKSNGLSGELN